MQVTLIHLEDRPRPGVSNVIQELQDEAQFRVMMLTGDHESSARRVASAVGINEFHCNLKPEDKLSHVKDTSRDMGKFLDNHFCGLSSVMRTYGYYYYFWVLAHQWFLSNRSFFGPRL